MGDWLRVGCVREAWRRFNISEDTVLSEIALAGYEGIPLALARYEQADQERHRSLGESEPSDTFLNSTMGGRGSQRRARCKGYIICGRRVRRVPENPQQSGRVAASAARKQRAQ